MTSVWRGGRGRKKTPGCTSQWNKARHCWSKKYNLCETQGSASDEKKTFSSGICTTQVCTEVLSMQQSQYLSSQISSYSILYAVWLHILCRYMCAYLVNTPTQVNTFLKKLYYKWIKIIRLKLKIISLKQFNIQWIYYQLYVLSLLVLFLTEIFPRCFQLFILSLDSKVGFLTARFNKTKFLSCLPIKIDLVAML